MIRAIIFDCFGVLATEGWLPFKEQYFGHDQALMDQASDLSKQANAGRISHRDFVSHISTLAGVDAEAVTHMLRHNVPNQALLGYIAHLKPQYKLAILSNAASNWLPDIFSQFQLELFDTIILSYEVGLAKPDAQIYEIAADRLGAELSECVFIDDQQWYVEAAKEVGMQGIWYEDFVQLKTDLKTVLAK